MVIFFITFVGKLKVTITNKYTIHILAIVSTWSN